ncbi:MAG: pilin [Patescibacteria group bacterium]
MKKFCKILAGLLFMLLAITSVGQRNVYAVDAVTPPAPPVVTGGEEPTVPGGLPDVALDNPFDDDSGIGNLCDLINQILNIVAEIGAIVGVLFIIWAGFLFIKAQGKPEEIQKAKSTFYTTVIGLAILLGASVIAKVVFNTVSSITTSFNPGASICAAPEAD